MAVNETPQLTWEDVVIAFDTGEVYNAPDELLIKYLRAIDNKGIPNEMVRHRAINRCITINTIINTRLVKKIDEGNTRLAKMNLALAGNVLILAIADVGTTLFQAFFK